jgi:hypothetical protein
MLAAFEDGHRPGNGSVDTKVVLTTSKEEDFIEVYEDVLDEWWRSEAYEYALQHKRPWGAYIPMEEVHDSSLRTMDMFKEDPIRAIGEHGGIRYYSCYYNSIYDLCVCVCV